MIFAFFPIIAAVLYGLAYVLAEKALETVNVATYTFLGGIAGIIIALSLWLFKNEPISWNFLAEKPIMLTIIFGAIIAPSIGWLLGIYAVKNISASYVAFAEISYPLFTLLFAFLLFNVRHWDWSILTGGALVMIGSVILVYGQISTQNS